MYRSNLQMSPQGSGTALESRLAAPKSPDLDRREQLRRAVVGIPFALGFLAQAAALFGPDEVRGPLLPALAIVCFLLGLSAACRPVEVSVRPGNARRQG